MLPLFPSAWLRDDHAPLADSAARFFRERWVPHAAEWREAGRMPRSSWLEAGRNGLLCAALPEAYGYMMEYPIAELWVDARAARIDGGSNEIMKELAARSM